MMEENQDQTKEEADQASKDKKCIDRADRLCSDHRGLCYGSTALCDTENNC